MDNNQENQTSNVKNNYWNKFIEYSKKYRKDILWNYLYFGIALIIVVLVDQITKITIFQWENPNLKTKASSKVIDLGIIGFRSVLHSGVTLIGKLEGKTAIINTLSIISFILMTIIPYTLAGKKILISILIGTMSGGNLGNMIDRFIYINGSVLDIFYVPFLENWFKRPIGTFNFADTAIVGGLIGFALYVLTQLFIYLNKQKKKTILNEIVDSENTNEPQNFGPNRPKNP